MKFRWSIVTSSKGSPLPTAYPTFLSISRLRETRFSTLNAPDYSPHYTWLSISDTPDPAQATQPLPARHFPCWWEEATQCLGNKTTHGPQPGWGRGVWYICTVPSFYNDSHSADDCEVLTSAFHYSFLWGSLCSLLQQACLTHTFLLC